MRKEVKGSEIGKRRVIVRVERVEVKGYEIGKRRVSRDQEGRSERL